MKKILFIISIILIYGRIQCQDDNRCYEYLLFKDFLNLKIENDTNLVKQIYKNVKYPLIARKNKIEGEVEVMIINHFDKKLEVIKLNQSLIFDSIESEVYTALLNLKIEQSTPFVTRFKIIFSLDKLKFPREKYEKFHLGLLNDNTFNIVGYIIPVIKY